MTSSIFSAPEIIENYVELAAQKSKKPAWRLLILAIVSGFIIGMGAVVAATATHSIDNVGVARTITGLLFSFGLGIVMLLGIELFTGNTMIILPVFEKKATLGNMFRNWFFVYLGNFIGSLLLAYWIVESGQLGYSDGGLAVYSIKVAVGKVTLGFSRALLMGVLCNILVCAAILCSLSAKSTSGRIMGAYLPICFFVIAGFEHSVANMYYIPVAILANGSQAYASQIAAYGLDTSVLTWGNFLINNLLPVTIGNIIGGMAIGIILWAGHRYKK